MLSSRGTIGGLAQRYGHSRLYKPGGKRGVIMPYGATGTRDSWFALDEAFYPNGEITALAEGGFCVASLDTLDLWGNATMRANISTLRSNMAGLFAAGKVHLVGVSAGGLSVLNWAKNNPTEVASISLLIPVIDVQAVQAQNRGGFASVITTAYGGVPPDADNPIDYAASLDLSADGIPTKLWYSTSDPITTAAESEGFAAASGCELASMGAVGHFWGPPWSGRALWEFIRASDA